MRDYKFRGKDRCGEWHYGSIVTGWMYDENKQPFDTAYIKKDINRDAVQVDPETVGQYTGVPDENGTDIYEKDRFKLGEDIGTVVFENGAFWVKWDEPYSWGIDRLLCNFRSRGEVVNPDLLGEVIE